MDYVEGLVDQSSCALISVLIINYSGHVVSCVVLRDNYQAIRGFDMLGVVGMFLNIVLVGYL